MTRPTVNERRQGGKDIRTTVPRESHAEWSPPSNRPDPVDLITQQDAGRLAQLVPIRHGRMSVSPFTFYRGAAKVMASDLSSTPVTGLHTQICGDAHLSNFGSFASPERAQVFDINDFDETLPGPWEWDVKRLATSFVLAGRDNGLKDTDTRAAVARSVASYRTVMAESTSMRTLDVWYAQLSLDQIVAATPSKKARERITRTAAKARGKDNLQAMSKLTEVVDGKVRIKSEPPLLIPLRDLASVVGVDPEAVEQIVEQSLADYRSTLQDNRRRLLDRYELVDVALKVVGVGSVGTRCFIALFLGSDENDPLFLQVKEATASVLEDHLPASEYAMHGQRVVEGQRLMQAASDIFLGWSGGGTRPQYYWRQFRDMKGSADIASMDEKRLATYASICGWTLAHAHARSGDSIAISGYMGTSDAFDTAIADFAFAYADQSTRDYDAFTKAIAAGRIATAEG